MSRLFSHNAYSILGLDTSVSQKEISKRSKEIVNLLKIDEMPEYDTDLKSVNNIVRDEATVNDAVQRLSSPIKRIQEYFFWFEIENDQDENNLDLLRDNQYDEALERWQKRAEKSLTAKRNFAIASSILLNHTGYKKYLKLSIDAWGDVVNSDKFWSHFEKVYALNDEIGTSKSAIDGFRSKALDYLSDFYADVSRIKKNNGIYATFATAFGTKGQKVQDEVLAPIFEQINSASEQLRQLNASQDNKLSSQESMAIKRLVKKVQDLFEEVKELGLYDDSHSMVVRDRAAEAINIVAVDLFNNLDEVTKSVALMKVAQSLASGPATVSQINRNIDYIQKIKSQGRVIDPINELIESEKYSEALELINRQQEKYKDNVELQVYFRKRIQWCVIVISMDNYKKAHELLGKGKLTDAAGWFQGIFEFAYQYVNSFDIDKESLDIVLQQLRNKLDSTDRNNVGDVDVYRQSILDNSSDAIQDAEKLELTMVTILIDSIIYQRVVELASSTKEDNLRNRVLGWVIFIIIIIIIGAIGGS